MFDSQKIDAYFDDKEAISTRNKRVHISDFALRRLIKIMLPCIAALLIGLMIIIPNIKKNVDLTDTITLPRKNEMEQLHIEKTVFNITDSKNRVNNIVAENVDELEAGSQRYKIMNPKATIPTDKGKIVITSKFGWFNQQTNVLELKEGVKAVIDDNTIVRTASAFYDFEKAKGWGKSSVTAKGDWGTMQAEAFEYDKNKEILILKGKHRVDATRGTLTGTKETRIYRLENKTVTTGLAEITQAEKKLYADKIVAYFSKKGKKELEKAEAYGNVRISTLKDKISGGEGYYSAKEGKVEMFADSKNTTHPKNFVKVQQNDRTLQAWRVVIFLSADGRNEIERAEAFHNVKITTPNERIVGGEGYYLPKAGKIELYGTSKNTWRQPGIVEIIQGENALHAKRVDVFLDAQNQIKNAQAFENVEVVTPKGFAWADKGVYNPADKKVELFNNVRLEQSGNYITGAHAETDLETSVSRITGDETSGGRISGTFYRKRK